MTPEDFWNTPRYRKVADALANLNARAARLSLSTKSDFPERERDFIGGWNEFQNVMQDFLKGYSPPGGFKLW